MAMPAKHRERLLSQCEGQLVATIDTQNPCVLIYPLPAWEQLEQEIQELPALNPAVRRFQRLIIGHATDLEFDSAGRVLLPQPLRNYAGLDKKVVLVGQGKKLELWSEDNWNAECDKALADANSGELPIPDELLTLSL